FFAVKHVLDMLFLSAHLLLRCFQLFHVLTHLLLLRTHFFSLLLRFFQKDSSALVYAYSRDCGCNTFSQLLYKLNFMFCILSKAGQFKYTEYFTIHLQWNEEQRAWLGSTQ